MSLSAINKTTGKYIYGPDYRNIREEFPGDVFIFEDSGDKEIIATPVCASVEFETGDTLRRAHFRNRSDIERDQESKDRIRLGRETEEHRELKATLKKWYEDSHNYLGLENILVECFSCYCKITGQHRRPDIVLEFKGGEKWAIEAQLSNITTSHLIQRTTDMVNSLEFTRVIWFLGYRNHDKIEELSQKGIDCRKVHIHTKRESNGR